MDFSFKDSILDPPCLNCFFQRESGPFYRKSVDRCPKTVLFLKH